MINSLDSRSIKSGDIFGQKFSDVGEVQYRLSSIGNGWPGSGEVYRIQVSVNPNPMSTTTHHVTVGIKDFHFTPSPAALSINTGDIVLWTAANSSVPGFTVSGSGSLSFNSAEMRKLCFYSHAFGVKGRYEWIDPNGSTVRGVIVVEDPPMRSTDERAAYRGMLSQGSAFAIRRQQGTVSVTPATLTIMTGQTVFWAVEDADAIAVVDSRLIRP